MVQGIQTIVSRNRKGIDDLVISVTQIHAGTANNVIPECAVFSGTVRTFDTKVQDMVRRRLKELSRGTRWLLTSRPRSSGIADIPPR